MNAYDKSTWKVSDNNILSEENITAIRNHLNSVGNIAVEHWHLYGGRAPTPLAFDDFDVFMEYLNNKVKPGDAIDVYPFPTNSTIVIAKGKYPDEEGRVPEGGAY